MIRAGLPLKVGVCGRYPGTPGGRVLWCLPGSAEGLRWYPLSEIEKPGSGTEPIHQEHLRCSRFRGSCPSDVKSAGHPEPGFPISLSGYQPPYALPGRHQRTRPPGVPGYRPHTPTLSGRSAQIGKEPPRPRRPSSASASTAVLMPASRVFHPHAAFSPTSTGHPRGSPLLLCLPTPHSQRSTSKFPHDSALRIHKPNHIFA